VVSSAGAVSVLAGHHLLACIDQALVLEGALDLLDRVRLVDVRSRGVVIALRVPGRHVTGTVAALVFSVTLRPAFVVLFAAEPGRVCDVDVAVPLLLRDAGVVLLLADRLVAEGVLLLAGLAPTAAAVVLLVAVVLRLVLVLRLAATAPFCSAD
jgi:hypothetical protein